MKNEPGLFSVTQMHGKEQLRRDFDAEEWSYVWMKSGDVDVLRLLHNNDPDATDSYDFVEFSTPVQIAFEREE